MKDILYIKGSGAKEEAKIIKAKMVTDDYPVFMEESDISRNFDGSWTIRNANGEKTGFPGKSYWVIGTQESNILLSTESAFYHYIVCDKNGEELIKLSELDEFWKSGVTSKIITSSTGKKLMLTQDGIRIAS